MNASSGDLISETRTVDLTLAGHDDYALLDSGGGRRLEQFGPYRLVRPSPVALWPPERPGLLWDAADAFYERGRSGEGHWSFRKPLPSQWPIFWQGLRLAIKPTGFGHLGFFPEHTVHWPWLQQALAVSSREPASVLHLFAYTGSTTLAAARTGARVCHVDAVADTIAWARDNAAASGMGERPIRWIKDDVMKFTAREIRRGRRYDGLILDPPSYGKGPGGERWLLEEHLTELLDRLPDLLSDSPRLVLFTCHSSAFSPALMRNLLAGITAARGGELQSGSMLLSHSSLSRQLPCGYYVRWRPSKSAATTV